ncbi:TPA: NisI/SpaI family lantibiotic immunity lipoprotein, partial [Streptococcus suis]
MRKILFSLVVLIGICTLVACRLVANKTIEFHDQSFNQFTYKGNDYTIMNQIVDENDLGTVKESFFKTLVIDRNSQKVVTKSNSDTVSLAYSGLYNFSDGLAISINDSYYKVSLSSDVQSNNEMLSL